MTTTGTSLHDMAEQFDRLPDPRCHINRRHRLSSVIVIAILAILAGCNGPTAIARWARVKEAFLQRGLRLPHGVPRKDVFRLVLTLLNPQVFQACFADWLNALKLSAWTTSTSTAPSWPSTARPTAAATIRPKGWGRCTR